jgi:hypothetical protein
LNLLWSLFIQIPLNTPKKAQCIALGFSVENSTLSNHHAAVSHNGLAGNVLTRCTGQENRYTANVIGLPNSAQGCFIFNHASLDRVVGEGLGKGGSDEARRNAIDADIVWPPFHRQVASQLHVGGFGNVVCANDR